MESPSTLPGGNATLSGNVNYAVPAADSEVVSLTVQQDPLSNLPSAPLPNNYWEYPIYGENRGWNQIAGNWLMSGYDVERNFDAGAQSFNPYTAAPNTGHVLWTKEQLFGGIAGGVTDMSYYTGSAYRRELLPPVVIDGKMYYNVQEPPKYGFTCIDLATGQTVWYNNATYLDATGGLIQGSSAQITLGQVLTFDTPNWHGAIPYLWSTGATTWAVWDAYSGNLIFTIANATTGGTFFIDQTTGTLLYYKIDNVRDNMIFWNSTLFFSKAVSTDLTGLYSAAPRSNLNWALGLQFNVSIPHIAGQSIGPGDGSFDPKDFSVIIASNQTRGTVDSANPFVDIAYSLKDGHVLWQKVRSEGTMEATVVPRPMSVADDCYAILRKETRQVYAYSVSTGEQKWVGDARTNAWGSFWSGVDFAYGKLYTIAYDGEVWAQDAKNGTVIWKWGPAQAGLETVYGFYPLYGGITIADNKVIVSNGEHSANSPLYKGERMYAIDANNGTTVWSIDGWYQQAVAANGVVLAPNGYDGRIYCFGKGPTATTLSIQNNVIQEGNSVLIQGTVTDISAGTKQSEQALRFPNGVPAVSDASITEWMSYVYQQQSMPTNATGVPVTLSVLDSNGNYRQIGQTTSDALGFYSLNWKPDIDGTFTIYASFAGSESYWPSNAVSSFVVHTATPTPTPATPSPQSAADLYFVPAIAGLFVAIIVVGALLAILLLRKRP